MILSRCFSSGFLAKRIWCSGRAWGLLLTLGLTLASAGPGLAALVESENPWTGSGSRLGDDQLLIDEVFQSHLPGTLEKYALRLSVNPHLGDWRDKDYMRVTTALRYGLTEKCEISIGSDLYFSHGNGDIHAFDKYGSADAWLGARFDLGEPLLAGWETGAGFDYQFITGRPPAETTDGLRHFRPYVTFSHRLESHPNLRIFLGFRLDEVAQTSVPGEFAKNAFEESSTGITGGCVVDRDRWHYTFEAAYDTNRLIGHGGEDIYTLRPGLLYEIPADGKWGVRSNWLVGVAVNSTFGPGGCSLGASFKVRYSSDLKNLRRRQAVHSP